MGYICASQCKSCESRHGLSCYNNTNLDCICIWVGYIGDLSIKIHALKINAFSIAKEQTTNGRIGQTSPLIDESWTTSKHNIDFQVDMRCCIQTIDQDLYSARADYNTTSYASARSSTRIKFDSTNSMAPSIQISDSHIDWAAGSIANYTSICHSLTRYMTCIAINRSRC